MRLAIAQFNPILGDFLHNLSKIVQLSQKAAAEEAQLIIFPELALTGYSPEDLLLRPGFYQDLAPALEAIQAHSQTLPIALVVGHPVEEHGKHFNALSVYERGVCTAHYRKLSLPNDAVFDEPRYFSPGGEPAVFTIEGVRFGLNLCEDIWHAEAPRRARHANAEILLVPNASPYHRGKTQLRLEIAQARVAETGMALCYVNTVGAEDELIFDGGSFALNPDGTLAARLPLFEAALAYVDWKGGRFEGQTAVWPDDDAALYQALVLGVRDYARKNRFTGALLGLSGGVDSALTLAIAVDALGAEHVHAVIMPSRFTAAISLEDAAEIVARAGCTSTSLTIEPMFESFLKVLKKPFQNRPADVTEENLQARIRGTMLMALSNKLGYLVLTTGNKSEMATGYCTLYGDMAGGFAVLKDVYKTWVYRLCTYRNSQRPFIPERVLTRAPSAELRADQRDQDTLPPYEQLDAMLARYIENNESIDDIVSAGFERKEVERVVQMIRRNEYKRRQSPPGPRVTTRAFGKDWRYPLTNHYLG